MAVFPSLDWFNQVRQVYNTDSTTHRGGGGACHTTAGLKIDDQSYLIVFEGLKCGAVRLATDAELHETDFIIEMPFDLWKAMVASVQTHGKADLDYTLNSLDLQQEEGIARSPVDDQYKQDLFYRYNQNFQDFFDASARIKTTFA
jgi:hypothetical protein